MKKTTVKKLMRGKVNPLDVLGFSAFVVAGFIWTLIAGFVVLGVVCLALSYFVEDE